MIGFAASFSLAGLSGCKSKKKAAEAQLKTATSMLTQVASSEPLDYGKQLNKIQEKMVEAVSEGDLKKVSKLTQTFVQKSDKGWNLIDYNNLIFNTLKEGLLDQYPEVLFHALKVSNLQKELEQKETYLQDILAIKKRSSQLESDLKRRLEIDIDNLRENISDLNESSEMASVSLQSALQKRQQMMQMLSNMRKAMDDQLSQLLKNFR